MSAKNTAARVRNTAVRVATANMDFNRGGDRRYIRHLKRRLGRGVLATQERGHGIKSVRVRGVGGLRVYKKRTVKAGKVGAHRGVATGEITLGGRAVFVISVHGLHRKTAGKEAQDAYYRWLNTLCRLLDKQCRLWLVLGDLNRDPAAVAALLGGTSVGHGVDGVIAGPGLRVSNTFVDHTAVREGWSDHPAVFATIWLEDGRD